MVTHGRQEGLDTLREIPHDKHLTKVCCALIMALLGTIKTTGNQGFDAALLRDKQVAK